MGVKLEEDLVTAEAEKNNAEAEVESLNTEMGTTRESSDTHNEKDWSKSDELIIQELVVKPNAILIGRSASAIDLRSRYGISLLAISREGRRSIKRLRSIPIKAGDVLLMQWTP